MMISQKDRKFILLSSVADDANVHLENTFKLLEELKDIDTLKEYEPIVKQYCQLRLQRKYLKQAVATTKEKIGSDSNAFIEKMFQKNMEKLIKTSKDDPYDCAIMRSYKEKIANLCEELNTSDVFATESSNDYIDPITKKTIQNPVRNQVCKHLYDKNSITLVIKQNSRTRCPVVGCSNRKPIELNMLVDDEDVALHLRAMETD